MQFTRWIRKYERTILVVLTVLLATSFGAGYGVPSAIGQSLGRLFGRTSPAKSDALGELLGRPVSPGEFGPFYVRWARFPFGVEKEEQAWTAYAGVALARELGIRVSDEEMQEFVRTARLFFGDPSNPKGQYSYTRFQEVLAASHMTQEQFEETLRELLSIAKLRQCLFSSVVVTSAEAWPLYREEHMSYDVAAVRFPADALLAQVPEPSAEEVEASYEAEKERRYREPERVRVELVAAPYAGFTAEVKATEEEAHQYYDAHPREFTIPQATSGAPTGAEAAPQVQPFNEVSESILGRLRLERARAEAERTVREAQRKLEADPQATMNSLVEASNGKLQAATSEFFGPAEVTKVPLLAASFDPRDAFIASLFNPKGGGTSPPSDVGLGREAAILCRVLDRQRSRVLSLAEAREKVVADLKHTRAVERASQAALALANELREKKQTLDSPLVRERSLEVETPPTFTVSSKDAPPYAAHLRGAERGAVLPAQGGDAAYVVEVRDTHPPTWEEFQRDRAQEKAFLVGMYRSWIMPARWDELVRQEADLKVFPKKGATESAEETPAGEGAQAAPPVAQTKPSGSAEPTAPSPEEKPGESSQPTGPSSQGGTNPRMP